MADYYVQDDDVSKFELDDDSGFLILDTDSISVPFIDEETIVYSPSIADASEGRISQLPVEVLVQGDSEGRISQLPVEVLVQGDSEGRISQLPVEVIHRLQREAVSVVIWP